MKMKNKSLDHSNFVLVLCLMSMKKAKLSCEITVTIETYGFDIATDQHMFMVFCRYEGYNEEHYHETLLPPQSRGEVSDIFSPSFDQCQDDSHQKDCPCCSDVSILDLGRISHMTCTCWFGYPHIYTSSWSSRVLQPVG
ncbi:unnamed protein product [Musa textilis]